MRSLDGSEAAGDPHLVLVVALGHRLQHVHDRADAGALEGPVVDSLGGLLGATERVVQIEDDGVEVSHAPAWGASDKSHSTTVFPVGP